MRVGETADIVVRMTRPIRILTADDHPLIRAGVSSFLATEAGLEVVAEAMKDEEALERYREGRPDVVLMDLSMPIMDGLAATRAILEEFPDARIVVLRSEEHTSELQSQFHLVCRLLLEKKKKKIKKPLQKKKKKKQQ